MCLISQRIPDMQTTKSQTTNGWTTNRWTFGAALFPLAMTVVGCRPYPDVSIDDLPQSSMVTTMSARRAIDSTAAAEIRVRPFELSSVDSQDGIVAHGPLWMEDPFEVSGSDDGQFAVTTEDFVYFPLGTCRFIINTLLLPISMVMDPPWTTMCSDGVENQRPETGIRELRDSQRCAGMTTPSDIHDTWAFEQMYADYLIATGHEPRSDSNFHSTTPTEEDPG